MEGKKEEKQAQVREIDVGGVIYRVKSVLPENRALRDILLRAALEEAVKLPA